MDQSDGELLGESETRASARGVEIAEVELDRMNKIFRIYKIHPVNPENLVHPVQTNRKKKDRRDSRSRRFIFQPSLFQVALSQRVCG